MSAAIDLAIESMRSTLGGGQAVYVSCPILGGKLAITQPGQQEQPNRVAAMLAGIRLRNHPGMPHLIEPARLGNIPGWRFPEYMALWYRVLDELCESAVFVDGWQYSGGCASEYLHCYRNGIVTYDESLKPIELEAAVGMIQDACFDIGSLGHQPSSILVDVLESLKDEAELADRPIPYRLATGA